MSDQAFGYNGKNGESGGGKQNEKIPRHFHWASYIFQAIKKKIHLQPQERQTNKCFTFLWNNLEPLLEINNLYSCLEKLIALIE